MVEKYAKAAANRMAAEAQRKLKEADRERKAKEGAELAAAKARAENAVWKAEYAYEVLRAIMEELRKGQRVTKPSLTNAYQRLEGIPQHVRNSLLPHDNTLDKALRKDDPQRD